MLSFCFLLKLVFCWIAKRFEGRQKSGSQIPVLFGTLQRADFFETAHMMINSQWHRRYFFEMLCVVLHVPVRHVNSGLDRPPYKQEPYPPLLCMQFDSHWDTHPDKRDHCCFIKPSKS